MMSIVGPVERSLSWAPAAAPWALLPVWQETLGWSGAGSVSWGIFLDFREVGRRNCTGKKKKNKQSQIEHPALLAEHAGLCKHPSYGWKTPPFPWKLGWFPWARGSTRMCFFVIYSKKSKVRAACRAGLLRTLAEEAPK